LGVGLLILGLLVVLSAFFSGTESAYISLSELDQIGISKSRSKNRKILARLLTNRSKLVSTILVGNNLVNIGASALATAMAMEYGPSFELSPEVAASLAAVSLTLWILVFGEVTPKSLALQHNRAVALFAAPILFPLVYILSPATWFLNFTSRIVHKLTGAPTTQRGISETSVIHMVEKGEELGLINERERSLIKNVFLFDEREVYPVMTPRTRVFALDAKLTLEEAQEGLLEQMYTRIPVYSGSFDHITGVVNFKEALKELLSGQGSKTLDAVSVKPIFVYETQSLSSVLESFQSEQNHMAVVVDEFGGMAGIVTLEDILEELVGEIYDEKDLSSNLVKPMGEHKWLVPGRHDVVTINKEIPGEIPIEGEYESLQGLIMSNLDRLPALGDQVQVGAHKFTVMKMNKNVITTVLLEYLPRLDLDREDSE